MNGRRSYGTARRRDPARAGRVVGRDHHCRPLGQRLYRPDRNDAVNQEIDALRTLGLDPVEVLVLPRLFGLILTLPLLVFFADAMGLIGGGLMTWASLGISIPRFSSSCAAPSPSGPCGSASSRRHSLPPSLR